MTEKIIEISDLTKDYGHGRGIFHVSFSVEKGECYGFLGSNGAGKTTTIRHLMGFSKPQQGTCKILGKDCWDSSAELKNVVGYLPGEISFPAAMTGTRFLKMMMKMRGLKDASYCDSLLKYFDLETGMGLEEMSLGMRRKLAVVTAFMHDPDILILDEPTSGLDPIMQEKFIEYIEKEKKRGKTILLSSHMFHEVDATCDRIAVIKDGHIVSKFVAEELKKTQDSIYQVTLRDEAGLKRFCGEKWEMSTNPRNLTARVVVPKGELNEFIGRVVSVGAADFAEIPYTLEDYFMKFYKNEKVFEGVK